MVVIIGIDVVGNFDCYFVSCFGQVFGFQCVGDGLGDWDGMCIGEVVVVQVWVGYDICCQVSIGGCQFGINQGGLYCEQVFIVYMWQDQVLVWCYVYFVKVIVFCQVGDDLYLVSCGVIWGVFDGFEGDDDVGQVGGLVVMVIVFELVVESGGVGFGNW